MLKATQAGMYTYSIGFLKIWCSLGSTVIWVKLVTLVTQLKSPQSEQHITFIGT